MFGYIVANIDALTPEQLQRYRGCYCGLCRELGRRRGQLSRFTLNYDMTFLVLLLSSLYEPQETGGASRCPVHPAKRHPYWQSRFTSYAADLNVALSYENCLDDWKDEKNLVRLLESKAIGGSLGDIEGLWPRQCSAIKSCLEELSGYEKAGESNPDRCAGAFGGLMGELLVPDEQDYWAPTLRRMGFSLGKFIYMLDACVDLSEDKKRGRYNPLALAEEGNFSQNEMRGVLTMLIADCTAEFEKLPLVQDVEILRNILYSGVWTRFCAGLKQST